MLKLKSCLSAVSIVALSLFSLLPAQAANVVNWECSWKGSYGPSNKQQTPLAFKGFFFLVDDPDYPVWHFRANSTLPNAPAQMQGSCDPEYDICSLYHKSPNGKKIYFSFDSTSSKTVNGVMTVNYAGEWGTDAEIDSHSGSFKAVATCRAARLQNEDEYMPAIDEALGWPFSVF